MNVLHINTSDIVGGAAIAGYRLHNALLDHGIDSNMLVGNKSSTSSRVESIRKHRILDRGMVFASQLIGLNYTLTRSGSRLQAHRFYTDADVLNLHNLHGGYLNYLFLKKVIQSKPVVFTLHDMWAMTGHCAYSLRCDRWRKGCGHCPDRKTYPWIYLDNTRLEVWLKRSVFSHKNLHVVTPSRWLAGLAKDSLLGCHEITCIPNGLDLSVFRPLDKVQSRGILGIPHSPFVLCFASEYLYDPRKGGDLLIRALKNLPVHIKNSMCLMTFGHTMDELTNAGIATINLGYISNDHLKSLIYSAADAFVLPSIADNLRWCCRKRWPVVRRL